MCHASTMPAVLVEESGKGGRQGCLWEAGHILFAAQPACLCVCVCITTGSDSGNVQEHAAISAALGLKTGDGGKMPDLMPEATILHELQMVEDRIAGMRFMALHVLCL